MRDSHLCMIGLHVIRSHVTIAAAIASAESASQKTSTIAGTMTSSAIATVVRMLSRRRQKIGMVGMSAAADPRGTEMMDGMVTGRIGTMEALSMITVVLSVGMKGGSFVRDLRRFIYDLLQRFTRGVAELGY